MIREAVQVLGRLDVVGREFGRRGPGRHGGRRRSRGMAAGARHRLDGAFWTARRRIPHVVAAKGAFLSSPIGADMTAPGAPPTMSPRRA